jgi:mRNA interferase RelE/StbE
MEETKRATIYFDAQVHQALRLRAAASNRSISEMVNEAVRIALAEDADDLRDVEIRQAEPSADFEEFVSIQEKVDVYRLTLKKSASKELQAVSGNETLDRLIKKIKELANNPRPQGSEKLAGRLNLYRFRQGDYRVIYSVDDQSRLVDVIKIGHRRDVYR